MNSSTVSPTRRRNARSVGCGGDEAGRLVEEAQEQGGGHLRIARHDDLLRPRRGRRPRPAGGRRPRRRGPGRPRCRAPPGRRPGSGPWWDRRRRPCRRGSRGAAGPARPSPRARRPTTRSTSSPSSCSTTAAATSVLEAKWWYSAPRVTPARSAISSRPVAAKPFSAKSARAACEQGPAGPGRPGRPGSPVACPSCCVLPLVVLTSVVLTASPPPDIYMRAARMLASPKNEEGP